jgi:hypothetical protein
MTTAIDLATEFYRSGLGGTWLNVKRTNHLRDLALREHEADCRHASRNGTLTPPPMYGNQVYGELDLGPAKIGHWTMRVSPVNGCGFFACQVSDIAELTLAHRAEVVDAVIQKACDRRFLDLAPTVENLTAEAAFIRWAKGYVSATHEHDAWTEHDEAVETTLGDL